MLATDGSSDEEDEDAENPSSQRPRVISGDDLGDSFLLDEEPKTKRGWVDEIFEKRDADNIESEEGDSSEDSESSKNDSDEEGSDEDNDAHEENQSIKDWEQSDDDNLENGLEGEEEESDEDDDDDADEKAVEPRDSNKSQKILAAKSESHKDFLDSRKKNADGKQPSTRLDIPYLIEAPKSYEEFCALLDNRSNSDIILIINRIRASNAIKLAAENRKKMQV